MSCSESSGPAGRALRADLNKEQILQMKQNNRKKAAWIFAVTFLIVLAVLAAAMLKTSAYNHTRHHADLAGTAVFSERGAQAEGISVTARPGAAPGPRFSTCMTKA